MFNNIKKISFIFFLNENNEMCKQALSTFINIGENIYGNESILMVRAIPIVQKT